MRTLFVLLIVMFAGCQSVNPFVPRDLGHARERAMAEIAIASVTASQSPTPIDEPRPGKCPDCNDPPGACGVGKVGDGRICVTCRTCGGDGQVGNESGTEVEHSILEREVPKEVNLRVSGKTWKGWPSKWHTEQRAKFESAGWIVRVILGSDTEANVAYFDVVAPDGEMFQFFEPITLESVKHLEQR